MGGGDNLRKDMVNNDDELCQVMTLNIDHLVCLDSRVAEIFAGV